MTRWPGTDKANAARLLFSMGRDRQVPGARFVARVSPTLHTPVTAILVTAMLAAVLIFMTQVEAVTVVLIYLAYTLCTASALVARRGGWPSQPAAFSLGRAGLAINAAAVLWGVAMIINLAWYRPTDGAPWYLNLATLVFVPVIILVGLIYYYGWQKRRPSTQPEM